VELVGTRDLTVRNVERAPREEAHATLGFGGFMLGEGEEGIRFIFVIADIAVAGG
jgi:hypothetical protein